MFRFLPDHVALREAVGPLFLFVYAGTIAPSTPAAPRSPAALPAPSLPDVNPEFVKLARSRGFYSEDLMKKVAEHGSVRDIPEVPEDVRTTGWWSGGSRPGAAGSC